MYPDISIDRLIDAAEKKFGVAGVGHILQGRFLGDIPLPGGLYLSESLDPDRLVAFFHNQAKAWIARRIADTE